MVVSVPQTKAGVIGIVRVLQAAGENSSRQPTTGFLTSNGPCGRALFRPSPTGPRAAENWTRSPPHTTVVVCAWAMGSVWTAPRSTTPICGGRGRSAGNWAISPAVGLPTCAQSHPTRRKHWPCGAGSALVAPPGPPTPAPTARIWPCGLGADNCRHLAGGYGAMGRSGRGCRSGQNDGHRRARGM